MVVSSARNARRADREARAASTWPRDVYSGTEVHGEEHYDTLREMPTAVPRRTLLTLHRPRQKPSRLFNARPLYRSRRVLGESDFQCRGEEQLQATTRAAGRRPSPIRPLREDHPRRARIADSPAARQVLGKAQFTQSEGDRVFRRGTDLCYRETRVKNILRSRRPRITIWASRRSSAVGDLREAVATRITVLGVKAKQAEAHRRLREAVALEFNGSRGACSVARTCGHAAQARVSSPSELGHKEAALATRDSIGRPLEPIGGTSDGT